MLVIFLESKAVEMLRGRGRVSAQAWYAVSCRNCMQHDGRDTQRLGRASLWLWLRATCACCSMGLMAFGVAQGVAAHPVCRGCCVRKRSCSGTGALTSSQLAALLCWRWRFVCCAPRHAVGCQANARA
jgi:hypothetical protein